MAKLMAENTRQKEEITELEGQIISLGERNRYSIFFLYFILFHCLESFVNLLLVLKKMMTVSNPRLATCSILQPNLLLDDVLTSFVVYLFG